ncbi:hypothetical protein KFK09_013581 [Dendrobium nobile]|uniref:Replication protein A OB domain-containing protein n=1 Tax=Dendrobium nobile TaxID=94219 RepID=A0A8T3BAK4_DENNO|nr:hypothetical protein KFK09_013581 [Dendrobium nobile]
MEVFSLKENMRARTDRLFCDFILRIGNGDEEETEDEIHLTVDQTIQSFNKNLSTIEEIMINPNLSSDVVLLVLNVNEVRAIYRQKDKKKILKRDLQVIGLRSEIVTFTLWEELATNEGKQLEDMRNEKPIIFATGVVGKIFNGFNETDFDIHLQSKYYASKISVKLYVEDDTSNAILTLFDNEAECIIGLPLHN